MSDEKVTITLLHIGDETAMPMVYAQNGPQWTFARMHRDGDVVDAIVAAAELVRAELVVMPTEGRHGVFDALRGSTTERVLRRLRRPLLAVPAPQRRSSGCSHTNERTKEWQQAGCSAARSTANSLPAREVAQLAFLPIHAARRAGSAQIAYGSNTSPC